MSFFVVSDSRYENCPAYGCVHACACVVIVSRCPVTGELGGCRLGNVAFRVRWRPGRQKHRPPERRWRSLAAFISIIRGDENWPFHTKISHHKWQPNLMFSHDDKKTTWNLSNKGIQANAFHFFFFFLEKSVIQVNWNSSLFNSSVQLWYDNVGNELAF